MNDFMYNSGCYRDHVFQIKYKVDNSVSCLHIIIYSTTSALVFHALEVSDSPVNPLFKTVLQHCSDYSTRCIYLMTEPYVRRVCLAHDCSRHDARKV